MLYVCHVYDQCLKGSEDNSGSPRTGVIDVCKILCGSWKPNLGPLPDQPVLLTNEPSL